MAKIFISASSGELTGARLLANTLIYSRGYDFEGQDGFDLLGGDLLGELRTRVDRCDAVLQLVGFRYGGEPQSPEATFQRGDSTFNRYSFTQYEALYAEDCLRRHTQRIQKVYYLIFTEKYPFGKYDQEPDELKQLQLAYRRNIESGKSVFYFVNNETELKDHLRNLRIELSLSREPDNLRPWHPPRAADQFFGRRDEITDVATLLRQHRRVALTGAGGMGKTALAHEVITRLAPLREQPGPFPGGIYSHDYFQSPGHPAALISILAQAGLEQTPDRDRPAVVTRLLDQPGVLLYLEGCEKAEQLFELLNLSSQVKVLLTTRDQSQCPGTHPHEVRALDPVSAAQLLAYHAGLKVLPVEPSQRQPWLDLANRLGRHPLALLLAGAYLLHRRQTPVKFLEQLTREGFAFWDTHLEPKENLRVLFRHSADAATAKHPRALEAWFALALHAHAPVPISALCGALACDADEAERRLGALQDYSLAEPVEMPGATVGEFERAWQLTHALLGEWARGDLSRRRREESLTSSPDPKPQTADPRSQSPDPINDTPPQSRRRREGSLTSTPAAGKEKDLDGDSLRRLLQDEGKPILTAWLDWWNQDLDHCFKQRCVPGGPARYQALQPHWNALLTVLEQTEGSDSTLLSFFLNQIALTHKIMGNHSTAEPLYRRALECRERVLGLEHPETLTSVNNLAELLRVMGELVAAEPLHRRALKARESMLGPEHLDTLESIGNLAVLLYFKGDLNSAEVLFRRALEVQERVLGLEHRYTLISVNNLAALLQAKGDLAIAEALHRRALEVQERVLGPEHPDTLSSVHNLAGLLYAKRDLAAAEPLYRRALEARERVLGPDHPDTLNSVNNLAGLLYAKGDLATAEPLYRRALETFERVLGPEHPDTLGSVNNLALLLESKGDLAGALPLFERAAQGLLQKLGPDHPNTKNCQRGLALVRQELAEQKKH